MPDVTLTTLQGLKQSGEKIAMLTCYDALTAEIFDRAGIDMLLEVLGFAPALERADLVVTGEGSLDAQTLHGKAPAAVAALAAERGIAVVAVCGVDKLDDTGHAELGVRQSYSLTDFASDLDDAMTNGAALLETIGARLATDQLAG